MLRSLILPILIFSQGAFAQPAPNRFQSITTGDGLSASWVRCIYQDEFGFIYLGTSDGLNRYDAYNMHVYYPGASSDQNLINGAVNFMAKHSDTTIWVCTELGISLMNTRTGTFTDFPFLKEERVSRLVESTHKKIIWFATYSGLYQYDTRDSSIVRFHHQPGKPNSLSDNQIESLHLDIHGKLWIGTHNGLDLFDPATGEFRHYYPAESFQGAEGNFIKTIFEDPEGRIYISTEKLGFLHFRNAGSYPEKPVFDRILPVSTQAVLLDSLGLLWLGNSFGEGIIVLDYALFLEKGPEAARVFSTDKSKKVLTDNTVSVLFQDRDLGIWIGSYAGGLSYYSHHMKPFWQVTAEDEPDNALSNNVVNVFLEEGNYLWIGTEEGLNRIDKNTGKAVTYYHEPGNRRSLGANGILALTKDSRGRLWIGTWAGGLSLFHPETNDFTTYLHHPGDPSSISSNNVFTIVEDREGKLWLGTNGGGLNHFDPETGIFTSYLPDPADSSSISGNAINDICLLPDGHMLISTYHVLELFNPQRGSFRHIIFDDEDQSGLGKGNILDIFQDREGRIFLGTTRGFYYYLPEKNKLIRFSTEEGLPNNTVQSITEDDRGDLWLGTNHGLARCRPGDYFPDSIQINSFFAADGLSSNEFVRRSVLNSSDNKLYFGTTSGYTWFTPEDIVIRKDLPNVALTGFKLIGTRNNEEGNILSRPELLNSLQQITLKHNQADFEIEYAALNYVSPVQTRYRYMLEGYDTDWHEAGTRRLATYTNIDPGNYIFKVKAANEDGIWGENIHSLKIRLEPPWHKTLFARILFVLTLLFMVYGIHLLRIGIVRKQNLELENRVAERTQELTELNTVLEEKQEEISLQNEELSKHRKNLSQLVAERTHELEKAMIRAEQADKLKSAFLANMSHEIRTPMNAIVGFASMLSEKAIPEQEKEEFIEIINKNCEALMVLINDILDISLIEANQLTLSKTSFSVTELLKEQESYFRLRNTRDVSWEFVNSEEEELIIESDVTRFRQVMTNLLNNAAKYTEKGAVRFGFRRLKNEIQFFVSDTGIGIAESEYENIFNYFHKIDPDENKLYRGAGIGLSISNKLVELMGGKIWLDSKPGEGTTFYFTLPRNEISILPSATSDTGEVGTLNLKEYTIIIAEDESANFILLKSMLEGTGAEIIRAKNGLEAVEAVGEVSMDKPLIVLMDIKMPVLNGINAAARINSLRPEIPIIAITAYAHANDKAEIMKHAFVDYLAKPLKSAVLMQKIRKHTKN